MKLKDIPTKKKFNYLGSEIEVLSHGNMGTRICVLSGDTDVITLGKQVWSGEVEVSFNGQDVGKFDVSTDLRPIYLDEIEQTNKRKHRSK